MLSIDTNILFHALNADSPNHSKAASFLDAMGASESVSIAEFVLVELYRLLRNPVVVSRPLAPSEAVRAIQAFRSHPRWKLVGFPDETRQLHDQLWRLAGAKDFAYRRVFDARLALILRQHGVTEFATVNTKDFAGFGFARVWNPLA